MRKTIKNTIMETMSLKIRPLRWLALAAILFNIVYNYIYMLFPGAESIKKVTDDYPTLFTPAGYAFSIWGLIYLSLLIYGIVQLLPSQRLVKMFDELAIPTIIVNVAGSLWIYAFSRAYVGYSLVIILINLYYAFILFSRSNKAVRLAHFNKWLRVPFSLLAGWLTVASIACTFTYLKYSGWAGYNESFWTVLMICVATMAGLLISVYRVNYIYPAVIAWALFAIYIKHRHDAMATSNTGLSCAIFLAVVSVVIAARHFTVKKQAHIGE